MGIAEDVAKVEEASKDAGLCKVGQIIKSLDGEDAPAIEYAINRARFDASLPQNQRVFTAAVVHRLFVNNDHHVGITTVKDHLSRKCACDDS